MFADLHLHTNFSDGTYTPEELAALYPVAATAFHPRFPKGTGILVEEYLDQLGREALESRAQQTQHLLTTLQEISRPMGGKPWDQRDQLHER